MALQFLKATTMEQWYKLLPQMNPLGNTKAQGGFRISIKYKLQSN